MKNLAGKTHWECDDVVEAELLAAQIEIVRDQPREGEVASSLRGRLGDFTFERAWYYWVVKGRVPIAQAWEIYFNGAGQKNVRVSGHASSPAPTDWVETGDDGMEFISSYHIDSQEGLNLFTFVIRRANLV